MKRPTLLFALALTCCITVPALAVDYGVQPLNEPAPMDELAKDIADQLAPNGVRVTRGSSNATYCDVWLCKTLETESGFKPTAEVAYPFAPGQLIGVARFARKGSDFRDQDINAGVYTLRYAQQPVDGAHVGTSPTRDFLLLVEASKDESAATLEYKQLTGKSAEAAGSSHPALLCLQKASPENKEFPAIRHNEEHDWWIVALQAQAKAEEGTALPIELVIVGQAAE